MSRKEASLPLGSPMAARIIYDWEIQSLEGRILTFIEALGLRESQEKSAKDIFRQMLYEHMYHQRSLIDGEFIQTAIDQNKKRWPHGYIAGQSD